MAIEKRLNTRILNKVDTLENWSKSTLKIKEGEICLATVAASAGNGLTEPVVMMKVGTAEEKTFAELPWSFYAKASDVLETAKDATKLTTFVQNVIDGAALTDNEAFTALVGRVDVLEGDETQAGSVAKAIKDAIDALKLDETYVAKEAGKSLVADTEIARLGEMSDGANKVEASATNGYIKIDGTETKVYEHPAKHAIDDVTGLQDALDGKADDGHKHVKADITDFAHTHTVAEVTDFDDKVKAYDYATKAEAEAFADGKDDAIAAAKKAGDDAAAALNTYKGEMTTALAGKQDVIPENTYDAYGAAAQALEDAKKYADDNDANTEYGIDYVDGKIKLVVGGTKSEIPADDFIKDGMIETVAISEDGKNLVITWNTDAGKDATTIPLAELADIYTGVDGTTVKVEVSSDDKISAEVKTGSIKDGHIASDAAIAKGKLAADVQTSLGLADSAVQEADIADLRGASHTHTFVESELNNIKAGDVAKWNAAEQNAKDYADDEIEKLALGTMSKEAAADYVKKTDAPGYGDILTKTEAQGAYQAKGEYYTKTEADAAFMDATETGNAIDAKITALDLANTYQAKGEYATAAQGGKADTAVQTVTAAADSGLKAVKTGTDVAIEVDDTITWIFDCGTSAE